MLDRDGNTVVACVRELADGIASYRRRCHRQQHHGDDVAPLHGDVDIQDNTITTFDLADNSVDADEVLDFGLSNQDVGVLFAQINADGTVANSSGGVTAVRLGVGQYQVDFGRNVSRPRSWPRRVTPAPAPPAGAIMGVADRLNNVEAVYVTSHDYAGASADVAFQLVVVN